MDCHKIWTIRDKALELWHRAAELDNVESYHNIGKAYFDGEGVACDMNMARCYFELAAMKGNASSRYGLGILEENTGNEGRALKHWMIASSLGYKESLKAIQELYMDGHATKDDYSKALQAYQRYLNEVKSDQRDKAAAFCNTYKYY